MNASRIYKIAHKTILTNLTTRSSSTIKVNPTIVEHFDTEDSEKICRALVKKMFLDNRFGLCKSEFIHFDESVDKVVIWSVVADGPSLTPDKNKLLYFKAAKAGSDLYSNVEKLQTKSDLFIENKINFFMNTFIQIHLNNGEGDKAIVWLKAVFFMAF